MICDDYAYSFQDILEITNEKSILKKKNLKYLAKKIYKFLHGLAPPIVSDIFVVRINIIHNLRNFQSLYSSKKNWRFGTETVTYRDPQIRNLILDDKGKLS